MNATSPIKLNIGAGRCKLPGFDAIDRKLGSEAYPLPHATDSVEEIRASHILEHFSFDDVPKVLREWVRVLKPGGLIRIAVPDIDKINGKCRDDPLRLKYIMGGQRDGDDFHRSAFTGDSLRMEMQRAGLVSIDPWHSENTDTASSPVSLNLQGRKPDGVGFVAESNPVELKICAVMSIPRIGWNAHWGCVYEALAPWKIPIRRYTGAYWEHGIQELLEASGTPDVVLTLDYDTVFTSKDFDRLLHAICSDERIDAVAALQNRRRQDTPLCTVAGENGRNSTGHEVDIYRPFKARTAHFGFTLIRTEALARMPKPWFLSVPNALGSWKDCEPSEAAAVDTPWSKVRGQLLPDIPPHLRVDADIWFWKQWEKAGNSLYIAPNVRVGHIEEMVGDFDDDLKARRTHASDWFKDRVEP